MARYCLVKVECPLKNTCFAEPNCYIGTLKFRRYFNSFVIIFFFSSLLFSQPGEMWPRSMTRFRGVFIGIVIGSGVVGLLVAWTNEDFYMTRSTPTIRPGKKWLL